MARRGETADGADTDYPPRRGWGYKRPVESRRPPPPLAAAVVPFEFSAACVARVLAPCGHAAVRGSRCCATPAHLLTVPRR